MYRVLTSQLFFILQFLNIMITTRVCFASRLGVSFSPAGLLTPFHIGVANYLQEIKILNRETTLAGSSGGALAACTSALSIPPDILLKSCTRIAQRCRDLGTFRTLRIALDEALFDILALDAHKTINNHLGLIKIAYTEVFPSLSPRVVSEFESREDLIQVLRASCTIPIYFSGYPAVTVRNAFGIDGFFAVERSRFGCPQTGAKDLEILVTPFDPNVVGLRPSYPDTNCQLISIISPALLPIDYWKYSTSELIALALGPPNVAKGSTFDSEISASYEFLFEAGVLATKIWLQNPVNIRCVEQCL